MKKKVVIEGVPNKSSKKKVVIEGLPKAQGGTTVDDIYYTPESRLSQAPSWYNWSKGYSETGIPTLPETTGYKVELPKQDTYDINLGQVGKVSTKKPISNIDYLNYLSSITPQFIGGSKYLNRALGYATQLGKDVGAFATLAKGKFKTPIDFSKYPNYFTDYSGMQYGYPVTMGYYQGGGNVPYYQYPGGNPIVGGDVSRYEIPLENMEPQTSLLPTKSNLELLGEPNLQKLPGTDLLGDLKQEKQEGMSKGQSIGQGIALGAKMLSDTVGIGANATKEFLLIPGNKNLASEYNKLMTEYTRQARVPASVESATTPQSFQGENFLAADGMQIREIGGKGAPTVEVEGDEHIQLPNGFSQEIKGKKHSEGGIPLNLPSGTKIFSEKLKVPVKFLIELIQINPEYAFLKNISLPKSGNISYADLAKKFETKKYVDLLNSKDADPIQMATAKLMIQQNNAALEKLFTLQEQNKLSGVHGPQVQQNAEKEYQESAQQEPEESMMAYGGLHKAQDGAMNFPILGNKKYWNTGYNYLDDIKLKKAFPQYVERGEGFFEPFSAGLERGNLMLNPIVQNWVIKDQGLTKEGTYGDISEQDVRNLENAPGFKFMKTIAEKYGKRHFDPTDTKMVRDYEDIVNSTYEAEGLPPYFQKLTDPTKPFSKEQKFGNWHASVAPIIRKSIGAGTTADSDTEAVRYVVEKPFTKKEEEQQAADAMRRKTPLAPGEVRGGMGIPMNIGIGIPIPQMDTVYAGDYYKLDPHLEFLKRVTPDYNPATRAMRAMITNATDSTGVGMANRQAAYANFLNQMGDIQNQANVQNIGIEQQEKFANRAAKELTDRINLQGYLNYVDNQLKAYGAKGTQEGLRTEAEKQNRYLAAKEANTLNAMQQAYFPGQYAQGTLGDVLQTSKYGGKVKKKVKIKPKLKK